jgi:DNA-binding GntR family transcriptional regulator
MNSVPKGRRPKSLHGVKRPSIREKAYFHIQQLVASGELPAGSGISELQLAKDLGSSRTPIREAMNQLAAEGMLTQSTSGGMVVAELKREDIIELYELREALEVFAVGRVASVPMSAMDTARLEKHLYEIDELQKELQKSKKSELDINQMKRFISCDLGFHALLVSLTNNVRLQKIVNDTRLLISIFSISRRGHDLQALKDIQHYHQRILEAVEQQKPDMAMAAVSEHIQVSQRERLNEYDYNRREASMKQSVPAFFDLYKANS